MWLFSLIFLTISKLFAASDLSGSKVYCSVQTKDNKASHFVLLANMNLNEDKTVQTNAIIHLYKEGQTNFTVAPTTGFHRKVLIDEPFYFINLVPVEINSIILNINIRISETHPQESVIETTDSTKYYSKCYFVN